MKGFALLVAALAGAAFLYVTTAVGSQQAGPTRAEFNALKKQVATLKKDDAAIQTVINACFIGAVPILRVNNYEARAAPTARLSSPPGSTSPMRARRPLCICSTSALPAPM